MQICKQKDTVSMEYGARNNKRVSHKFTNDKNHKQL